MARSSVKSDYLYEFIERAVKRGDYAHTGFPGERALSRETGLSLTTVRKAVARAVSEGLLVKKPNSHRMQPAKKRRKTRADLRVAIMLPSPPRYGHTQWCLSLERVCEERNHTLEIILYKTENDTKLWGTLGAGNHDLLFLVPPPAPNKVVLDRMKKNAHRLVILFEDYTALGLSYVRQVPPRAVDVLMRHLVEGGRKTIDCFNAEPTNKGIGVSVARWRQALQQFDVQGHLIDDQKRRPGDIRQQARELAHEFLRNNTRLPDAFFCTTGMGAIALTRGLADFGIRVGLDVAVCACSAAVELRYSTPSITSVASPPIEALLESVLTHHAQGMLGQTLAIEPPEFDLFLGESTTRIPILST